jgi:hypothetical protein
MIVRSAKKLSLAERTTAAALQTAERFGLLDDARPLRRYRLLSDSACLATNALWAVFWEITASSCA